MRLGRVDREGRVVVAGVRSRDRVGRRGDVRHRRQVIDVASGDRLDRDLGADLDGGGLVVVGVPADLGVGDVGGEDDAAARRARIRVQQAERLGGGREHRDVLKLLVITACVGLTERRGDRERLQR